MKINIENLDTVKKYLKKRLLHDWVILTGCNEMIYNIELSCFPPITMASNLFEMVLSPALTSFGFGLCKKTRRLSRFLSMPLDFEEIVLFNLIENSGIDKKGPFYTQQIIRNPLYDQIEAVDLFIARFLDNDWGDT